MREPYQAHSATSRAAAESIKPNAKSLRGKVLLLLRGEFILKGDGFTDEQVQERLVMPSSTERPRRVELVEMGLVHDSGRTRATRSGRQATVWLATPHPGWF
jgi:hypothetical protein